MMPSLQQSMASSKKSQAFTIDSLMGRDTHRSPSPLPARRADPVSDSEDDCEDVEDLRRPRRSPSLYAVESPSPPTMTGDMAHPSPGGFQPVMPSAAMAAFLQGRYSGLHSHPNTLPHQFHHLLDPTLHPSLVGLQGSLPFLASGALHGSQTGLGLGRHGSHGSTTCPPGLHPSLLGQSRDGGPPFYPLLMSRHGDLFSQRFAGAEPGYLLQPFRKPKRIRTAFSPSQLLRLEHAFEKNHYVVGQERKELAHTLSLTETQVKVWFQNRRTKYKRVQAEEDDEVTLTSSSAASRTSPLPPSPIDTHRLEISNESDPASDTYTQPLNYSSSNNNNNNNNNSNSCSSNDSIISSATSATHAINSPDSDSMPGSPKRGKMSHHVSRWRVETNQM